MNKKMIRVACLLLAVIIMLCPLSVCFAAESAVVDLVGEEIIGILWDTLAGWGIRIVESGVEEITDNVKQWLTGQLYEYLQEELNQTLDYWITGMQFYRDQFGRLIGNNKYVEAADDFANHLRIAFGITDNSTVSLDAYGYYIGNITVYRFPFYAIYTANGTPMMVKLVEADSSIDPFIAFGAPINIQTGCHTTFISSSSGTIKYRLSYLENDNQIAVQTGRVNSSSLSGLNVSPWYVLSIDQSTITLSGDYAEYSLSEIASNLAGGIISVDGIDAVTSNIDLPSNDTDYQPGYSIIYYPDGTIGYLDINWPETITVDNLPAIVSTGTVANPGIQYVFLPIKAFINTFEDGFGLMTQLVYNLPSEIVGMALAIMGAIIIFGTIKIMKEH